MGPRLFSSNTWQSWSPTEVNSRKAQPTNQVDNHPTQIEEINHRKVGLLWTKEPISQPLRVLLHRGGSWGIPGSWMIHWSALSWRWHLSVSPSWMLFQFGDIKKTRHGDLKIAAFFGSTQTVRFFCEIRQLNVVAWQGRNTVGLKHGSGNHYQVHPTSIFEV